MKTLFVSAETDPRETRVAATPTDVKKLAKLGWTVRVCRSAGIKAGFTDEQYADNILNDWVGVGDSYTIAYYGTPVSEYNPQFWSTCITGEVVAKNGNYGEHTVSYELYMMLDAIRANVHYYRENNVGYREIAELNPRSVVISVATHPVRARASARAAVSPIRRRLIPLPPPWKAAPW